MTSIGCIGTAGISVLPTQPYLDAPVRIRSDYRLTAPAIGERVRAARFHTRSSGRVVACSRARRFRLDRTPMRACGHSATRAGTVSDGHAALVSICLPGFSVISAVAEHRCVAPGALLRSTSSNPDSRPGQPPPAQLTGAAPPSSSRRAMKASMASTVPGSTTGGWKSASTCFQRSWARSVAVRAPASCHWPKFDQSET